MNTDTDRHDSWFIWMYIYKLWNDTSIYPNPYIFTLWGQNKFFWRKFFDCRIKMVKNFFVNGLDMFKNVDSNFISKYCLLIDRGPRSNHSLQLLQKAILCMKDISENPPTFLKKKKNWNFFCEFLKKLLSYLGVFFGPPGTI